MAVKQFLKNKVKGKGFERVAKTTRYISSALFPEYKGLKITRIQLFRASLPLHEGRYTWYRVAFRDPLIILKQLSLSLKGNI